MDSSKRKEISNRVNMYVMMISGIVLIISAIVTHEQSRMVLHIVTGVLFTVACLRHVIARRKAFMKAIRGK